MKKYISLFIVSLTAIVITTSCSTPDETAAFVIESTHFTRSGQLENMTVNFLGKTIEADIIDILPLSGDESTEAQNEAMNDYNHALVSAEKEAQLEIVFAIEDKAVENGMLIIGIETDKNKTLSVEIFNEEGFEKISKNDLKIVQGSNYKALNVKALENGVYVLRLKDDKGNELQRKVNIDHKQ
ncbi:T9SS type A sorting domain-containing protein [Aureispira]|nr:T9SS type A sorting domain-containing protein [Aureispira sp.]